MIPVEVLPVRQRAGAAATAGLLALWCSWAFDGPIALVLRIAAYILIALSFRWAVYPERRVLRIATGAALVMAAAAQLQNFYRAGRIAAGSDELPIFVVMDNAAPALLAFALAIAPRLVPRRSEVALAWTGAGLFALVCTIGIGVGFLVADGELPAQDYRDTMVFLRTVALAPTIAAAVLLMTPPRQLLTLEEIVDEARRIAEDAQNRVQQLTTGDDDLLPETANHGPPSEHELLRLLDARLARGEITEQTYLEIRQRLANSVPADGASMNRPLAPEQPSP